MHVEAYVTAQETPAWEVSEQYVWDLRYIDTPILRDRNYIFTAREFDETLYYTTDANMNVTALVNASI